MLGAAWPGAGSRTVRANCPSIGFGDVGFGSWPVGTGHPCFGCTEKETAFRKPLHALATVKTLTPPTAYPQVDAAKGHGISSGAAATVGLVGGLAVGAGAMLLKQMNDKPKAPDAPNKGA